MELAFKELGDGEPLVLLHGLLGSSDNWLGVAPMLASRFHLFILDLRNHGQSPHSAIMDHLAMAVDVREFLDARGIAQAHVLGHSLGGKVAMELALHHPTRVKALIVEDVAPRAYPPTHDTIFAALLGLDLDSLPTRQQAEDLLAPQIPSLMMRRFLLKNLGRDSTQQFYWKNNLRGIVDNYQQLRQAVASDVPFEKPALFIRGEKSDHITAADEQRIHQLFPKAEIKTIRSTGHWVHADAPREFTDCVLEFLQAVCAQEKLR